MASGRQLSISFFIVVRDTALKYLLAKLPTICNGLSKDDTPVLHGLTLAAAGSQQLVSPLV